MKLKKNINWLELMACILIMVLVIVVFMAGLKTGKEQYCGDYSTYTVIPGDTIYSIARNLNTNENLNKVIYEIRQDNNIEDCGNLQIGQQIKIRVIYE